MTLYLLPLTVSILSLLLLEGGGIVFITAAALGVGSAGTWGGLIGVTA